MAEQSKPAFKRRQYFINKRFQAGFIFKFFLILVAGAILSIGVTWYTTDATLTSSFDGSKLVIEKTSLAILPSVVYTNIITTLIIAVIAVIVTLLVSHKIAGPMFRFEKDLAEIAEGNLQKRIRIRNGDQFTGVAENLNSMVESLNSRLQEVNQELDTLVEKAKKEQLPAEFVSELEACRRGLDQRFQL